jgi:hypothetical protein
MKQAVVQENVEYMCRLKINGYNIGIVLLVTKWQHERQISTAFLQATSVKTRT